MIKIKDDLYFITGKGSSKLLKKSQYEFLQEKNTPHNKTVLRSQFNLETEKCR